VAHLRRSDCSGPGITRKGRGKGFEYFDEAGRPVRDPEVRQRIEKLAIPPAWHDVWICPSSRGHIQATGVDAAGRKQYRYHDRWRQRQDAAKFDEMLEFARALPDVRKRLRIDLKRNEMGREPVLACALRLLDRGFFRIGSESYAEENETYGLATMKKSHATVDGDLVVFRYDAKGKQRRVQSVVDPEVAEVVDRLKRRRGGIDELLAYKDRGRWRDVKSQDINDYLKEITGADFSAKDFRTWSATVLAAWFLALAEHTSGAKTARKRLQTQVVKEVAKHMGNTPAVCRSSYIDPRVFDRHDGGVTIEGATELLVEEDGRWPNIQSTVEQATIHLIEDEPALAKVA
jgi:DNA topoisomerase I